MSRNALRSPEKAGATACLSLKASKHHFNNVSLTSSHLYPLQVENCDSNSRLEVNEDDKLGLKGEGKCVNLQSQAYVKSEDLSSVFLQFTPSSLDLLLRVPFQLHGVHTVLQLFWRIELIVYIAISVLPGTHLYLSQVKHVRVKYFAKRHKHRNSLPALIGGKHDISIKT